MFEALGKEGWLRAADLDGYKTCLPHQLLHCLRVSGTGIRKDVNESEYLAALRSGRIGVRGYIRRVKCVQDLR